MDPLVLLELRIVDRNHLRFLELKVLDGEVVKLRASLLLLEPFGSGLDEFRASLLRNEARRLV